MGGGRGAVGLRNDVSSRGSNMPGETWADKGRYPLIKTEKRGDVVYGWSLSSFKIKFNDTRLPS